MSWTKGKRRHAEPIPRPMARMVERLVTDHARYGVRSIRALAADLGVSDRTVRRWLAGVDHPAPGQIARLGRWVRRHNLLVDGELRRAGGSPRPHDRAG